ncbi:hypothetical protein PMI10_03595, partial [Flavobacterium sp. CF136]
GARNYDPSLGRWMNIDPDRSGMLNDRAEILSVPTKRINKE